MSLSIKITDPNNKEETVGKIFFNGGVLSVSRVLEGADVGVTVKLTPELALLLGDELLSFYHDSPHTWMPIAPDNLFNELST